MIFEGHLCGNDYKVAIVISKFNSIVTNSLLDGCNKALILHGVKVDNIDTFWVPGAFEIPLIAKTIASTSKYDAIITLGAVIRGATNHYDYVCSAVSSGVAKVSSDYNIPVLFGVLTTDTLEQALERSGGKCGNKGYDVAVGALEMVNLIKSI